MVEGGQPRAGEPAQRGDVGGERRQQQRLDEPVVREEVGVVRPAVLRQQVCPGLDVELLGGVGLALELFGERRSGAVDEDVPQVAERDELPERGVGVLLQQQLDQLQPAAFTLECAGQRDEHVQQGRGERVDGTEVAPGTLKASAA
ncbi:hypothetical protein [Streptomyces sp. NPDC056323]|uniref:hypothetical protein n=1 Tax=unclassified Streptomyces TaxID=2593676 RepID=UPI0035DBEB79